MNNTIFAELTKDFVQNKKVLVRVDFNVPLKRNTDGSFIVTDNTRILSCLPTIKFLQQHNSTIILCSHLGRPDGKSVPKYSLAPIAEILSSLLGKNIALLTHQQAADNTTVGGWEAGKIYLLENLRFNSGEETNADEFSDFLASLADVYVNEAFSASHRSHASVVGVAKRLPAKAGFHFQQEISILDALLTKPQRPFVVVIGGAKISDKVNAVKNLSIQADAVLVGGGTANNFLKAEGIDIQNSYLEEASGAAANQPRLNYVDLAENMLHETRSEKLLLHNYLPLPKIIVPIDVIAATSQDSTDTTVIDLSDTPTNDNDRDSLSTQHLMYLDIGPKTTKLYQEVLLEAKTIFWNGPMGVFESPAFAHGTHEIARTIAKSSAYTVLGGGDTLAAINSLGFSDRFDYLSVAGGAALDYLGGEDLPGITALRIGQSKKPQI